MAVAFVLAMTALMVAATAQAMSLEEALALAYTGNSEIAAARAALRVTNEERPQAFAGWMPQVTGAVSQDRNLSDVETASVASTITNTQKRSVTLSQPLYKGGRTTARVEKADLTILSQRNALLRTEQTVLLSAVTAYANVLRDRIIERLRRDNVGLLARRLEATRVEFDLQQRTLADLSQAQSRLGQAQANLTEAVSNLANSVANFKRIIGQPPGDLSEAGPMEKLPATMDEAVSVALSDNPDVVVARLAVNLAESDVKINTRTLLPSVDLNSTVSFQDAKIRGGAVGTETYEVTAGVSVSVPLYQSGAELSRIRAAKKLVGQRRFELDTTLLTTEENMVNAWRSLIASRARVASFEGAAEAARVARDSVSAEFEVGRRTLLDLLNADQELLDAEISLVSGRRDIIVNSYRISSVTGYLTARQLGLPVDYYDVETDYERTKWDLFTTSTD